MILQRDDYDSGSLFPGLCSILRIPRQPEENGIFRCGSVVDEAGWLDISQRAVGEMAAKIGWLPPEQVEKLEAYIKQLEADRDELSALADEASLDTLHRTLGELEDAKLDALRQSERADKFYTKLESERRKARRYKADLTELRKQLEASGE